MRSERVYHMVNGNPRGCRPREDVNKEDISESRHIYFDSDNLNGTSNEHSKITKIEYRPIVRMYHTLFGFKFPYEKPNVDGEIRITVSEDERYTELQQLFDD